MRLFVTLVVLLGAAGCHDDNPEPIDVGSAPQQPKRRFSTTAGAPGIAGTGADGGVACAATCQSDFGQAHYFGDPADGLGLVGRWLVCGPHVLLPPEDQAGVELTRDGRLIILRRDSDGHIVRGTGVDAAATFDLLRAERYGSFELFVDSPRYGILSGTLFDCPKGMSIISPAADGIYHTTDFIFDTGIEPSGCRNANPVGCDLCGNLECPPDASLTSECMCVSKRDGSPVRPLSQSCNNCCGKRCDQGKFLSLSCGCF